MADNRPRGRASGRPSDRSRSRSGDRTSSRRSSSRSRTNTSDRERDRNRLSGRRSHGRDDSEQRPPMPYQQSPYQHRPPSPSPYGRYQGGSGGAGGGDMRDPRLDRQSSFEQQSRSRDPRAYDNRPPGGGGGTDRSHDRPPFNRDSSQSGYRDDRRFGSGSGTGGGGGGSQGGGYGSGSRDYGQRGGYGQGGSGGSGGGARDYSRDGGNRASYGGGGDRGGYGGFGGDRGGYGGFGGDRGGGFGGGFGGGGRGGFNPRQPEGPPRTEPENIEVFTNYFEVISKPNWTLYQYHVDFEPKIESKRLRMGLLRQHDSLFVNKAFDGMTLYSLTKLDQEVTELKSTRNYDQAQIILKVKLVNQVLPLSTESLRMFNIIFKRCLYHCKLIEFGRDRAYYDFNNTHDIQKYHLKVAAGYKASMDIYENKLLLCTEIAHKLINYDTVWNVMERFYRDSPLESYKKKCIDYLVGQTVMTNYNKKTYKIDDIIWDEKPSDSFEKRNGESITYIKYYKEHYNITIREEHQPLLVSLQKSKDKNNKDKPGSDQPVHIKLIPEFCALTGNVLLKEFENNFAMKKDLDAITKLNPEVRYSRLRRFLETLRNQPDAKKDLENWKIDFSSDVIKVNATVLAPITVQFKNQTVSNTERGWNNSMRNGQHLTSIHLKNWILIYFPRDESKANMFCDELRGVSDAMGFSVERCTMIRLPDSRGSLGGMFASVIREKIGSQQPQLVVCIVPNTAKDTYDAIKRTCCIDFGIPSQVVTSNILNMSNMNKTKSVITKLAIQMNCKIGGEIWGVLIPMKNIMIIGMDFYKDSAQKNSSVAAFIASINGVQDNKLNCTKYFSKCHLQPRGNEFADGLQAFMTEALKKYNERNNTLPDRIFVYRDGVSDNQFDNLSEFEIPQMKSAFNAFGENYKPKMTFFVVKKRSNARFFLKGSRNEFQNPPIGTVIDNTVTKRKGKEFYLIAQSSNQGTVSPTHFHVIEDENEMPPDRLQIITYRLTHLYYNWPGQIRVPAPCHYAHKLAHLVGESLHRPHSPLLDESLFYL